MSAVSGTTKLAVKTNSSALGFWFARGTRFRRFPRLLQLTKPVVLVLFRPFFQFSPVFHYKITSVLPKRATGTVNISFCRLSQGSRLLLLHFFKATLQLRRTRAPIKENTTKNRYFCEIIVSFVPSKAFHTLSLHCKKKFQCL